MYSDIQLQFEKRTVSMIFYYNFLKKIIKNKNNLLWNKYFIIKWSLCIHTYIVYHPENQWVENNSFWRSFKAVNHGHSS